MSGPYYRDGDYNVICDRTGFKVKASQTRREWNGLRVMNSVWDPRHPQDFVSSKADHQAVPDPRGEGANVFLSATEVTPDDL